MFGLTGREGTEPRTVEPEPSEPEPVNRVVKPEPSNRTEPK